MKLYPDLSQLYIESGAITTPASRRSFGGVLRLCQSDRPDQELCDWTAQQLAQFCTSREPAPNTIKHRRACLRSSFQWAHWSKLIPENPAADLNLLVRPGRGNVRVGNWLTDQQVEQLLSSYDVTDELERRDRLVLLLGLFTGLRAGTLATLTWANFSPDLTVLRVRVKGGKERILPVADQLRDELLGWRELSFGPAVIPSFRVRWVDGGRDRAIDWDEPLGPAGISDALKRAGRRIGVDIAPHDMRRSFAGWLRRQGLDPGDIRDLMCHANIQTTYDIYLDRDPARLSQAMSGLRRAL